MSDYARGEHLAQLRDARRLSQEDAAHGIGVSAKSLRGWEHGKPIRWENAKRVAAFYGVDAETLVSRELEAPPVEADKLDHIEKQLDRIEEKLDRILKDPEDDDAADVPDALPPERETPPDAQDAAG